MRVVKSADELLRRSLVWRCVNGGVVRYRLVSGVGRRFDLFRSVSLAQKRRPAGRLTIFSRTRYFFSAFAAGRTGFSLSRCMLM